MEKLSRKKYFLKNILLLLTAILFSACANQLPPGGGEPDRIPPEIIEVFPAEGTINYDEDYIEIGFSEYVDKRSAQDAVFVSPAVEGGIEYTWSGKYLRIEFEESLKEKTTYVVTLGTDVADYNNKNRMAQAYTLTFSTGDEIDRRTVTGKVYDDKAEDVMIFAYKLSDTSSNPLAYKPDYISQAGKNGDYKLSGLAAGKYRVFAVEDKFRDLLFQPEQDRIGIPSADISFAYEDTFYAGLDFFLTSSDTTPPRLISTVMTDEYHILVTLSEEVDSSIITKSNFRLIDSASGKISEPFYAYKGNTKAAELVLVITDRLQDSDKLFVISDTLKDREGNYYLNDFAPLTVSSNPDTTKPKLYKTIPPSGSRNIDYQDQSFYFFFDDAFNFNDVINAVIFNDKAGKPVKYSISSNDDASFIIKLSQKLEPQKDYLIEIDLSRIKDAAGNSHDSLYKYGFKTINGLDFTGVSGIVTNAGFDRNPVLILKGTSRDSRTYKQQLRKNNFSFERIEAGKYLLQCFYDRDSSNTYTFGWPVPFQPSEEFFFHGDTLNLRPRWTVTDIKFNLKK